MGFPALSTVKIGIVGDRCLIDMLPRVRWGAKDADPQQTGQFRLPEAGGAI